MYEKNLIIMERTKPEKLLKNKFTDNNITKPTK